MTQHQQRIFLMGGADLEMRTIASLLLQHGEDCRDASLSWDNAVLSRYAETLEQYGGRSGWHLYGVELRSDCPLPDNYTLIDHHNRPSARPTALEQVADLFGASLTRYQQLVAANDAAYIPGMQALGAMPEEIACIRVADRKAQGVTDEDERLALISLIEGTRREGTLWVVEARTSRFSPICDRLFPYDRLLIHTDEELMYYGQGVGMLALHFADEIRRGRMFYGGGENGYFGVARGAYPSETLRNISRQIQKLTAS